MGLEAGTKEAKFEGPLFKHSHGTFWVHVHSHVPYTPLTPSRSHSALHRRCRSSPTHSTGLAVLAFLIADPNMRTYLDLTVEDEDGLGLLSTTTCATLSSTSSSSTA